MTTISADDNSFTDEIRSESGPNGGFDVSIHTNSSFVGTLTLQRKRPGEADSLYRDVKTYTTVDEEVGESASDWIYRLGCKTGEYTSGSIVCELWT